MKKKVIVACILALTICSAFTIVKQWKVDSENSRINFELPAHNKKGLFQNLKATIDFDERHLAGSKIIATIDVSTISVGNVKHETHLKSPDFFNAEKFPVISFTSTEIIKTENGYTAKGKLTMKDSIKPVEIPFTYTENGNKAIFDGTMTINAGDFGVMSANSPGADKVLVYLIVPVTE